MKKRVAPVKKGTKEAMSFRKEFCHCKYTINEAGKLLGLLSCSLNRERQYNNKLNLLCLPSFFYSSKKSKYCYFAFSLQTKKFINVHIGVETCSVESRISFGWPMKQIFMVHRFQKHQLQSSNVTGESLALFRNVVSLMRASFLNTTDNDGS